MFMVSMRTSQTKSLDGEDVNFLSRYVEVTLSDMRIACHADQNLRADALNFPPGC